MRDLYLYRLVFILVGAGLVVLGAILPRRSDRSRSIAWWALTGYLCLNIGFVIYLWFNHVRFPLNLDLTEGTLLQEFQRAASFRAIYPEPSSGYFPLAYNPLSYFLAVPFSWIFGVNLFTLRFVAILGMVGSGAILYLVVRGRTKSRWCGFAAVGLFAGAYRVMDAYLDSAHADSWLLFSALLGTYLIDRNRSRISNLAGVIVLVLAFWFKQHGALFAIGGLIYLTGREGLKGSLVYWLTAVAAGPLLYLFGGPTLFGPYLHYFTWEVPRRWSSLGVHTLRRYFGFIALSYPVMALSGGLPVLSKLVKNANRLSIWDVQFVFALLSGFMGSLDSESSQNVFIPMGMWFILLGSIELWEFSRNRETFKRFDVQVFALFVTLALFIYNPSTVIVSPRANAVYGEFVDVLNGLKGNIYAPSLGQLQRGYTFHPAAHWVALEDVIRGPGLDTRNHPSTRRLLEPTINPGGPAYIIANYPLDYFQFLAFLEESYVLEEDFGDRFKALRVLPKRFDHSWPRYLYRYKRSGTSPA